MVLPEVVTRRECVVERLIRQLPLQVVTHRINYPTPVPYDTALTISLIFIHYLNFRETQILTGLTISFDIAEKKLYYFKRSDIAYQKFCYFKI